MAHRRRQRAPSGPVAVKIFKRLLLFLVVLVGALESATRLYVSQVLHRSSYPLYRFNSYRIYEHIPGYQEGENGRPWVVINGQGFRRGVDTPKLKAPGSIRIFLMGGSAAYGMSSQAPYPIAHLYPEETIDAVLEKRLQERHPQWKVEVINAALTGYQLHQHTAYLQGELLDYNPDLIVFHDGVNDHYLDNPEYDSYRDCQMQFWKPRLQSPSLGGWLDYSAEWLGSVSATARYFSYRRRVQDILEHFDPGLYPQMIIGYEQDRERIAAHRNCARRGFLRSLETNLSLLQREGVSVLVSRQSQLSLRQESLLTSSEREFLEFEKYGHNYQVLAPVVAEEVSQVCQRHRVPFVDLVPVFNQPSLGGKQLFIDWCHLTPIGAQVVAEALLPEVEELLTRRGYH